MPSPRRRGGQPHNRNAVKHGFYARQFEPDDLADLAKIDDPAGLDAEIALIRVTLRRLTQSSRGLTDFESLTRLSRSIGFLSLALTRLLRVRSLIKAQDPDDYVDLISEKFKKIMDEVTRFEEPEKKAASAASLPPSSSPFSH